MDLPTAHAWRDQSHEFFYPARNATLPTATAVYTGRSWDKTAFIKNLEAFRPFTAEVGDRNKKKNAENKKTAKYPLRTKLPDHQPGHAKQTILANHFELKVDTDCLYEYEILDLDNDGRSRKRIQALFQRSIDAWPHLNTNKDSFATDKRKIIVSWKDLHQNFIKQPQLAGNGPEQEGAVWPAEDITTGRVPITARFKFVGKVNLDALRRRAEANFQEVASDPSSAERCLNILISKTFDQDVHRLSTNKFFVKRARNALHYNTGGLRGNSESLEIIRGYYYAIRPGTGSLMMNFNVATSAFFRPVLVSEFLADTVTFKNTVEKLSILSKLRVYVEPDHKEERFRKLGARIKTIAGLGDNTERNIKDLSFNKKRRNPDGTLLMVNNVQQYESNETFVIDHLKEGKS
jgi:eukaryotic translation initiation factor 2C